jgi:hypothetical protein
MTLSDAEKEFRLREYVWAKAEWEKEINESFSDLLEPGMRTFASNCADFCIKFSFFSYPVTRSNANLRELTRIYVYRRAINRLVRLLKWQFFGFFFGGFEQWFRFGVRSFYAYESRAQQFALEREAASGGF